MSPEVKSEFARMLAARHRLLDLRSSRIEQLLRVRVVMRALLGDFFETLDPIVNVRLAEVSADGSKAHGVLAVTLSFFEGTRMRLAVDTSGRFSHSVSIPSAFDDVGRIVEIDFSSDMKRAEVLYAPVGEPDTRRRLDLVAAAMALLAHAVAAVEEEASEAPAIAGAPAPLAALPLLAPVIPASATAAKPAPPVASPKLSIAGRMQATAVPSRAPTVPVNADVLTFNVG